MYYFGIFSQELQSTGFHNPRSWHSCDLELKIKFKKIYLVPILKKSLGACKILASIMIVQIIRPYFKQSYINPLDKYTAKHHLRKERDLSSARFKSYRRTRKTKYRHPCSDSHFPLTHLHLPTPFQFLSHHHKTVLLSPCTSDM